MERYKFEVSIFTNRDYAQKTVYFDVTSSQAVEHRTLMPPIRGLVSPDTAVTKFKMVRLEAREAKV